MNGAQPTTDAGPSTEVLAFPASVAQQVFWYLELLQPGVTAFNVPIRFRLEGPLDGAILEGVLNTIVARHEALRTHFEEDDGELLQIVRPELRLDLPVIDLRQLPAGQRHEEAERLAGLEARRPFELSHGPLVRAELVRLAETSHILHVTFHHAVFDGWSMTVFTEELARIYQAYFDGHECPLEPLAIQYGDFSVWQKEFLAGPEVAAQLAFWKRKLHGMAELDLPTDRPRPLVKSWRGDLASALLPRELTDRLQAIAARNGATLYHLLLTAYKVLLHRYSGATDIVVGSPITGRTRAELEPLIGVFINSLILRSDLSGDPPFEVLLRRVRDTALEAVENQDMPFEFLVRALKPERDASRNPLFQVNFTHQRSFAKAGRFGGVDLIPIPSRSPGAIFDLHFFMVERAEGWRVTCDFSTDLFDRDSAVRMLGHFQQMLEAIAADPSMPIDRIGILTGDEQRTILGEWSGTVAPAAGAADIGRLFVETAQRHAGRIALVAGDRQLTYRQLHAEAAAVAARLIESGVAPGALVALVVRPSSEAIIGIFGILLAGAAYVPVDPDFPVERTVVMLEESGADHAVAMAGLGGWLAGWGGVVVEIPAAGVVAAPGAGPVVSVTGEHPAYLLFTSGSTGRPKGVVVPHRAVVRLVRGCDFIKVTPEDVFLQAAPLSFDASTLEIFAPLLNGARLVVPPAKAGLDEIAAAVREHGVTTLWLTAGLFQVMIDEHPASLRGVRQLLAGGDVLSVPHVRQAFDLLPNTHLINGYGPTENTTFTTCHRITRSDLDRGSIPIGRPIAGTCVFILDHAGRPVPAGIPGELHAGGAGLALRYHNDHGLTEEKFVRHPEFGRLYRTGDLCRWLPDGVIEFLGRDDHQVKVRGFRIEPGEIESVLVQHPAVARAKVGVRGAGAEGKRILAWVMLEAGQSATVEDLAGHLRERLPAFMCPEGIAIVPAFPLNANGKIDVAALPDPLERSAMPAAVTDALPAGDTEQRLAGIWRVLLGVESPGRDDEFFELGGNSLTGLRLFARIRREFGVSLPLATLLRARTLRTLAEAIDAASGAAEGQPAASPAANRAGTPVGSDLLATVQAGGELPPLCAIHGGDGGILFYQSLAGRLPVERPFLAIESPELSSSAALEVGTVEATATRYIRLLKQARRAGPYLLAGYSFGGVVAYEMARQLVEAGDEVSFLGLIDTLNPAISVRAYSLAERVAVFWDARHAEPLPRRLWSLAKRFRGGIQTNLRVKAELAAAARCEHAAAHSELRGVQLREAHYRAMKAYRPLPYAGTLTLFRASEVSDKFEFPEDYGWRGLPAELRVVEVAGEHLTIFEDAHIEPLAREFARHLPPPATSGQAASTSASANERVDAGQNVGQVIHSAIP